MKSVVVAAIAVCALVVSTPAHAQLRPKVKVLTTATTPVPPECAQGTVAPPPRIEVTPPPPPVRVPETPLRGTLSTSLRAVQQAAERDDYAGFKDALANARAAAAAHERGGERDAAEDALAVYRDVERLWDYTQTSATGAFFSADDRELMDAARRYGASAPMNVGGATLYATRETRQAVTRAASDRLARIGIHVTSRSTMVNGRKTSHTDTSPAGPAPKSVVRARSTTRATTHSTKSHTPVTHMARAVPPPAPAPRPQPVAPTPAPVPQPQPAPVVPAPAPAPLPMPAPVPTQTQPTTTTQPAPDTASTETGAFSTATDATTTTATTSSAPSPRPTPTGTTNLILRIIVVLIAIGLLVALFRASS